MSYPAYLDLLESGALEERARQAAARLADCDLCPRLCHIDRGAGRLGYCATGALVRLASAGPHFGEEAPLVGRGGSGTIFVSGCSLCCGFCQNAEISLDHIGREVSAGGWAELMLGLQRRGCHNINIVTPSHVVPQLLEALSIAARRGLCLPLVYNSGGYDLPETLRLLESVVDIYMPDFKFWDPDVAARYADARDYPEVARGALREMHRQAGDLVIDGEGIARRGLLVRHLVLPEGLAGTGLVCEFLAQEVSRNTYVNIMDQYQPTQRVPPGDPLARRVTPGEFAAAMEAARAAGLQRFDARRESP